MGHYGFDLFVPATVHERDLMSHLRSKVDELDTDFLTRLSDTPVTRLRADQLYAAQGDDHSTWEGFYAPVWADADLTTRDVTFSVTVPAGAVTDRDVDPAVLQQAVAANVTRTAGSRGRGGCRGGRRTARLRQQGVATTDRPRRFAGGAVPRLGLRVATSSPTADWARLGEGCAAHPRLHATTPQHSTVAC